MASLCRKLILSIIHNQHFCVSVCVCSYLISRFRGYAVSGSFKAPWQPYWNKDDELSNIFLCTAWHSVFLNNLFAEKLRWKNDSFVFFFFLNVHLDNLWSFKKYLSCVQEQKQKEIGFDIASVGSIRFYMFLSKKRFESCLIKLESLQMKC